MSGYDPVIIRDLQEGQLTELCMCVMSQRHYILLLCLIRLPDVCLKALSFADELFLFIFYCTFAQPDGTGATHQMYTRCWP